MDEFGGSDAKSKEVVRLWRAWRTVHEMVEDRVSISWPPLH
jgi:DNA-directed RNA polymerase I, II, and III subunit RPABC1